jgi:putative membrane protein insertion efficiency factor
MALPKTLLLVAIAAYRKVLSPLLPASCRFHPSCSQYAFEAVAKHGAGRGTLLALGRLKRCHPWHPGGFDPVPVEGDAQEDLPTARKRMEIDETRSRLK